MASGANLLLTFKNVRNEAGKGAKIFDRATQAAVDLSASGFGDLSGTSKQLGKALNDPIKGISALGRAGVTFTASQKATIASMVKNNNLLGAQKIILKEVESQVGGSAAATATAGEKMSVAFKNFEEQVGTALLPLIDKLEKKLVSDVIPAVSQFVTELQDGTGTGGKVARVLGDIATDGQKVAVVIGKVVSTFEGLPGASQRVLLLAGAALLLKNRFGESVPSLQSFNRESALAATKTLALRGGALAAGVGLAALASQAGGTKTSLGALATVGAGLATGFAVGGPLGAAIGGVASALTVFSSRSAAAASAQRDLDTAGRAVAATILDQTGALKANARAVTAKSLADAGAFTTADKVGVSYKTVLAAALGNAEAQDTLAQAVFRYQKAQDLGTASGRKAATAAQQLLNVTDSTSRGIDKERQKVDQTSAALGKLGRQHPKPTVAVVGVDGAIHKVSTLLGLLSGIGNNKKYNGKVPGMFNPGHNAKGTDNWRGGMTLVGEKGPELINLAKGAQVIPIYKIGDVSQSAPSAGGMGMDEKSMERAFARALAGASFELSQDNRYLKTKVRRG